MKRCLVASVAALGILVSSPLYAAEASYSMVRSMSTMIVDASRTIIRTLPDEADLATNYSPEVLAAMITQMKKVLNANVDHVEVLMDVMDAMYKEINK